ncbi:hypothetical protein [Mesorhizobium captivum]|nr:hypothetical protein [Mesorhizobium sp. VK3C]MDX8450599.1 hypothetical protein [Mesorhizobium sp. VK3C]
MPELSAELAAKGTNFDPASISRNGYRFKKTYGSPVRKRSEGG